MLLGRHLPLPATRKHTHDHQHHDWARISGKKGERIVFIRTLVQGKQGTEAGRSIESVANTGQYL